MSIEKNEVDRDSFVHDSLFTLNPIVKFPRLAKAMM